MSVDPVEQAVKDGKTYIGKEDFDKQSISHKMLGFFNRKNIVEKVKAPLMAAIILAGKLSPKPTMKNVHNHNSRILLRLFDEFLEGFIDPRLKELYEAVKIILVNENEHDIVEYFVLNYFAEKIYKEVESGDWILNKGGCPQPGIWRENHG